MLLAESLLGSSSVEANYIEDVFSTYLYTGNGSTQTINNGIDLAGKGGLVWIKQRSGSQDHTIFDTARGVNNYLRSNSSGAQNPGGTYTDLLTAFNASGFSLGADASTAGFVNGSGSTYASWTFREQPKFFDIVTYTGNGVAGRTISHNLGSTPGCIIIKTVLNTNDWAVYHRGLGPTYISFLNSNGASSENSVYWNNTAPTSTVFSVGTDATVNSNGQTYVAYLFAHNAGGFGLNGDQNVIACDMFTTNNVGGETVFVGFEPQLVIAKSTVSGNWIIFDNLRGMLINNRSGAMLTANAATAELNAQRISVRPNGFSVTNFGVSEATIYIAIRRGPMRTPVSGTSVFNPLVYTGTNVDNRLVNTSIAPDMVFVRQRNDAVLAGMVVGDRLRGQGYLLTDSVASETEAADAFDRQLVSGTEYGNAFSSMNGFWCGNDPTAKLNINTTSNNHVAEAFKRAPSFFDIVPYVGTEATRTVAHGLGVAPELILVKAMDSGAGFRVYNAFDGINKVLALNENFESVTISGIWGNSNPTTTTFGLGPEAVVNASGVNFIAYLFASCPGVSKVGSYTGTGATQVVNCGFAAGARFVLIKRTDSTGDWYVWDSARGIVAGNDPYLLLNSTAAEVTTTDWVDTAASGFELSNAAGNLVNTNGASYIFLSVS